MSEVNQLSCPHCGQAYAVRPEQWAQYNGRTINCTKCGRAFVVTLPPQVWSQGAWAPPGAAGASAPPMQPPPPPAFGPTYPPPSFGGLPPGYVQPPSGFVPGVYGPPPRTSGWAITSLVIGIVGLCVPVVGGVIAIVSGILGIIQTRRGRLSGRGMAIAGLVLGIVGLLVATPLEIASVYGVRMAVAEQAHRAVCKRHMIQLGGGLFAYARAHHGRFPETLGQVMQSPAPPPLSAFVCPDDDKSPPAGPSATVIEASIDSGRHCSYIYKGRGLTDSADPDTVILYEPLANHNHLGMHVLHADGTVEWLEGDAAMAVLREMNQPAIPDTTEPATEPAVPPGAVCE